MKNKKIPESRVKPPQKVGGGGWIRRPEFHGDPNPEGTQKLTHGSAKLPFRGGAIPFEWFDGFGWTTSKRVCEWFEKSFENYEQENYLKIKAFKTFHPVGPYEFRSPNYSLFDLG